MQAIRTKYFGPTDSRYARIQAKCEARTIYLPYAHELNIDGNHAAACEALLRAMGWHGEGYAPMVGGYFNEDRYWVFTDERDQVDVNDVPSRDSVMGQMRAKYERNGASPMVEVRS